MKKSLILLGLLALLASPGWASGIGIGAGFWDTSDADAGNGISFRLDLDVWKAWSLELRGAWLDGFEATVNNRLFRMEATPFDVGVTRRFGSGKAEGYAGGGFSYTFFDVEVANSAEAARMKDEPGWFGVLGVDFNFHPSWALYLEGLYRQTKPRVQGDGLTSFDTVDIDFAGAAANVGIKFSW